MYTRTGYVSRYLPALDTVVTFPVVYWGYSAGSSTGDMNCYNTASSRKSSLHDLNMETSRPSVIKFVPRLKRESVKDFDEEKERDDKQPEGLEIVMEFQEEYHSLKMCNATSKNEDSELVDVNDDRELDRMYKTEKSEPSGSTGTLNNLLYNNDIKEDSVYSEHRENIDEMRIRISDPRGNKRRMKKKTGHEVDRRPSDNKRHVCSECNMRFKKPSALVIHMRTHSGERPYTCEICDKKFSISGNLRRHMFTHTGEKPYKCQACGRGFNNPSHLARHSKKIHILSLVS